MAHINLDLDVLQLETRFDLLDTINQLGLTAEKRHELLQALARYEIILSHEPEKDYQPFEWTKRILSGAISIEKLTLLEEDIANEIKRTLSTMPYHAQIKLKQELAVKLRNMFTHPTSKNSRFYSVSQGLIGKVLEMS